MPDLLIPLIVITFYLMVLIVLGYAGWKKGKAGMEDYYLSSRGQGWLVTSLTIMATFFSSFALLGAPGMLYAHGIGFTFFYLNVPISASLIWIFGYPLWKLGKKFNFLTPADALAFFYESDVLRVLVSLAGLLYVIPYIVIQLKGGGYLFESVTKGYISFKLGATILAVITMIYVIVGGLRSVAWTDVVQGVLLISGMIVGGIITVKIFGGVSPLFRAVAEKYPEHMTMPGPKGFMTIPMLFTYTLVGCFGTMVSPAQWMRYYAARSPETLRRAVIIFAVCLTTAYIFGTTFIGLGGKVLFPDVKPDTVFLEILVQYLPLVVSSALVTSIIAASMSTADSNLHAMSAILTRDIYQRFIRPKTGMAGAVMMGRIFIVVATVVSLWIAITRPGMIVPIAFISIAASLQIVPPLLGMLFWQKGTGTGASLGIVAGLVSMYIFKGSPWGIYYGAWAFLINSVVFWGVSRFTRPPSRERVEMVREVLASRRSVSNR